MFWGATHRKIVDILEVDREVNDPNAKNKRRNKPSNKKEKIGLKEALKRF